VILFASFSIIKNIKENKMYFWKIDKLKQDLIKKPLSESESFKYLFIFFVGLAIAISSLYFVEKSILEIYSLIIDMFIMVIGLYYVYKCNKGANGNNFLQKFFSIGWVVGIRWFVFMILIFLLYYGIIGFFFGVPDKVGLNEMILQNLLTIIYYWRVGKHIKEVATADLHPKKWTQRRVGVII
jgi:hypothetical protein